MKVVLLTTWDEPCGVAEHSQDLVRALPEVEFEIIGRPFSVEKALHSDAPIVHLSYEPGLMPAWGVESVQRLRAAGKKTVLTWHVSSSMFNKSAFTDVFDRTIIHEKTDEGFTYIPVGIIDPPTDIDVIPNLVGTAGFPFAWKGFWTVAEACQQMGLQYRTSIPKSRHGDAELVKKQLQAICHTTEVNLDYLPKLELIRWMTPCAVQVYAYSGGNAGLSGGVRVGLATGRPTVISQCRQFRDLFEDYAEELYIIPNAQPSVADVCTALEHALVGDRKPKRILEDMSWTKVAAAHLAVYQGLLT